MVTERPISSMTITLLMFALFITGIMMFYTDTIISSGGTLTDLEKNITQYKAYQNDTSEMDKFLGNQKDTMTSSQEDIWTGAFTFDMVFGRTGIIQQFFDLPNTIGNIFTSLFGNTPELQAQTRLLTDIISLVILAVVVFAAVYMFFKVKI